MRPINKRLIFKKLHETLIGFLSPHQGLHDQTTIPKLTFVGHKSSGRTTLLLHKKKQRRLKKYKFNFLYYLLLYILLFFILAFSLYLLSIFFSYLTLRSLSRRISTNFDLRSVILGRRRRRRQNVSLKIFLRGVKWNIKESTAIWLKQSALLQHVKVCTLTVGMKKQLVHWSLKDHVFLTWPLI